MPKDIYKEARLPKVKTGRYLICNGNLYPLSGKISNRIKFKRKKLIQGRSKNEENRIS